MDLQTTEWKDECKSLQYWKREERLVLPNNTSWVFMCWIVEVPGCTCLPVGRSAEIGLCRTRSSTVA